MKTSKLLRLRRTVLSVTSSAVLLLTAFPAVATPSANSSSNPLQGLMDWFNEQVSSVQKYANGILNDKLKALSETIGPEYNGIVSDLTGALGLPDSTQVRKKTEEVASNSDNILYGGDRVANNERIFATTCIYLLISVLLNFSLPRVPPSPHLCIIPHFSFPVSPRYSPLLLAFCLK